MKYVKKYWQYSLFLLGFMILAMTFTYTRFDWSWLFDVAHINVIHNNITPLVNLITILLVNTTYLRVLSYALFSVSFFVIIRNIINKKNNALFFIGAFLFFVLNQNIINESYISAYGFIQTFIPLLFILTITNYLINDNLYKLSKPVILILGFLASSFNPTYSILALAIVAYKIVLNVFHKEINKNLYPLTIGVLVGNILMLCNGIDIYQSIGEISENVLYTIVPNILNINFIFAIISIAFIFRFAIKLYIKSSAYRKTNILLSLGAIIIYAFVSLFSTSAYLNYLSSIFYFVATFYILINGSDSPSYREKIKIYYFIKLVFFVIVSFLSTSINISFLPALMDIIIILELVNITFPTNFLKIPYMVISLVMVVLQIILNNNTNTLIKSMNIYLQRDLSCGINSITLPSKYKEDSVSVYLPMTKKEKTLYLKYLKIDDDFDYEIEFTEKEE